MGDDAGALDEATIIDTIAEATSPENCEERGDCDETYTLGTSSAARLRTTSMKSKSKKWRATTKRARASTKRSMGTSRRAVKRSARPHPPPLPLSTWGLGVPFVFTD